MQYTKVLYLITHDSSVHSDQMYFLFNLSTVTKNEKILTAELHLFKLKPRPTEHAYLKRHHFCQVSPLNWKCEILYEIMLQNT